MFSNTSYTEYFWLHSHRLPVKKYQDVGQRDVTILTVKNCNSPHVVESNLNVLKVLSHAVTQIIL